MKNLNIVTMGGAGGQSQILKALKDIQGIEITSITPSTDSGGSTGILKEDYGAQGYLGDLTKCIVALCPDKELAQGLMYRYGKGDLSGHSVKNVLLLALENALGPKEGLKKFAEICKLDKHRVLPVTNERSVLCARLRMGNNIIGETNIDELAKNPLWHPDTHAIEHIYLKPKVSASKEAVTAIALADWLVICPGDFYSSIIPTLLPSGIKKSIRKSDAKVVLMLNIVNKKGETQNYTADDFVKLIEEHIGKKVSVIFCNNKKIPASVALDYALENKIEFTRIQKNMDDSRIRYAPFVQVTPKGSLIHNQKILKHEFEILFNR